MSRTRRNFSAKFKSELVIELLKGEKDLNTIATENNIQPNLLRNWKKEFLDKASVVFNDTREDNLKEKLALERKEKAEYAKKVGQLTMQVDWLKKNLKKHLDLTTRVNLVQNLLKTKELPVKTGATLLDINRTSVYYKGMPISQDPTHFNPCFYGLFFLQRYSERNHLISSSLFIPLTINSPYIHFVVFLLIFLLIWI